MACGNNVNAVHCLRTYKCEYGGCGGCENNNIFVHLARQRDDARAPLTIAHIVHRSHREQEGNNSGQKVNIRRTKQCTHIHNSMQ